MSKDIQRVTTSGALNAEHYQTFEIAKANDGILGGNDIAKIRSYAAYARAQAQAIHKTIAATSGIDDVAAIKAEATETAQTFAKVGLYADQRIGEILRELPTRQGKRNDLTSSPTGNEVTKSDALKDAGFTSKTAAQLEQLAANPEVVEAVIAKATEEGRVVSRKQVIDAINAKKHAESERDSAVREMQEAYLANESMELEVESLKEQLRRRPKPEVVTKEVVREVIPDDYDELRRTNANLVSTNARLINEKRSEIQARKEAERELREANELLGENGRNRDANRDIEYLTMSINAFLRDHGGEVWAFNQFDRVDETTQAEFSDAIHSLAAFAQNISQMIDER